MLTEDKRNKTKFQHIWSEQMYRLWHDLQRQYFVKQYNLLEYPDNIWEQESWHIILKKQDRKKLHIAYKNTAIEINDQLDSINLKLAKLNLIPFEPIKGLWRDMEKETEIAGILIPMSALVNLGMPNLSSSIHYFQIFSQHFPFHDIILQSHYVIKDENLHASSKSYQFLWHTIESYSRLFSELNDDESVHIVYKQVSTIWNHPNLTEALPSEQLTHALLGLLIDISKSQDSLMSLENYHNSVREFLETHNLTFRNLFSKRMNSTLWSKEDFDSIEHIKQSFYHVCAQDYIYMYVQDLLNSPENKETIITISPKITDDINSLKSGSLVDKFQNMVQNKSIIDRLKSISFTQEQNQLPDFYSSLDRWDSDHDLFWHQLTQNTILEIDKSLKPNESALLMMADVQKLQIKSIQQTLNTLTNPVLEWKVINDTLMPLWNTCQHENIDEAIEMFNKKRALELKESKRLHKTVKTIQGITHEGKLDEFVDSIEPFQVNIFAGKLNQEIKTQKQNLRNRRYFKSRKMEEFGITEELERSYRIREKYLEELLKIEEEVRPFTGFVKKAFDSALPENKENFFNPYRHSIDGIEFDPETIQDVDKWLKGEVMKTINIKPQIHDALQINCFAMDSSGSMDQIKMRNLFKIIYLIILGLSGKASYDSFHFFGTYFVPAADFNHSFSSKNLLYKILRKITHIDSRGKICYSGVGGTFLSGAIEKCHSRISEFSKPFKEKEINHHKSLFVITDGEPSIGVVNPHELAELINQKRQDGDVSIKGIYVGPKAQTPILPIIFGDSEYVETPKFENAIIELIEIMSQTFKEQRKRLKQLKKQRKSL